MIDWSRLTSDWDRDGFLVIDGFFSTSAIADLRTVTDDFIKRAATLSESDSRYDLGPGHSATTPRVRRIKTPDEHDEVFRRFAREPRIVELLGQLFGRGIRLEIGKVNLKLPGEGGAIAWHQDYPFSPLTNDDSAAVGIFIDDVTEQNGPLLVVAGSHKRPLQSHHRDGHFIGSVDPDSEAIARASVRAVTAPAGSISIHHCRTLHASGPNRSNRPRRIYFNQYLAADAWPYLGVSDVGWWTDRLLSGEESFRPRVTMTDVELPLPAEDYGSIFELQGDAARDQRQFQS